MEAPPAPASTTIKIGTLTLTRQAFGVVVMSLIVGAGIILSGLLFGKDVLPVTIITGVVVTGAGLYYAYIVNCTIVGHCDDLAWFMLGIFAFNCAFSILTTANLLKESDHNSKGA
jgi:hypothetical protein